MINCYYRSAIDRLRLDCSCISTYICVFFLDDGKPFFYVCMRPVWSSFLSRQQFFEDDLLLRAAVRGDVALVEQRLFTSSLWMRQLTSGKITFLTDPSTPPPPKRIAPSNGFHTTHSMNDAVVCCNLHTNFLYIYLPYMYACLVLRKPLLCGGSMLWSLSLCVTNRMD